MDSGFNFFMFGGILSVLFTIAGFVIWIAGLIDCLKRDFDKTSDKIIWLVVILLLNALGSIIYYFLVVKAEQKKSKPVENQEKELGEK